MSGRKRRIARAEPAQPLRVDIDIWLPLLTWRPASRGKGTLPVAGTGRPKPQVRRHDTGEYTISDFGELFSVSRPTVYRTIKRAAAVHT